ncbi:MAG TPA: hypothetical protein VGN37_10525 [Actinocatenispora sp.]
MSGLLFISGFAVLLGLAQLLGWVADSRDGHDWHPPQPERRPVVVPLRPPVGPQPGHRHRPAA